MSFFLLSGCSQGASFLLNAAVPSQDDLREIAKNGDPTDPNDTIFLAKDTFRASGTSAKSPAVDVLFVMDNSPSMSQEQALVVASFSKFLEGFVAKNVDYHIGVVSTDSRLASSPSWGTGSYANFPNAGPGSLLGHVDNGKPFINRADFTNNQDVIAAFQKNATLGVGGSGAETALLVTTQALSAEKTKAGGWNAGFFRNDSLVSIILVSDEDEAVGGTDTSYIKREPNTEKSRVDEFVNTLRSLRPSRPDLARLDLIISPPEKPCAAAAQDGATYEKAFKQYYPTDNQNNGKIMRICDDFSGQLGALGGTIAGIAERRFALSKRFVGSLIVKLNDVSLVESSTNGYTYDPVSNIVTLNGLNLENLRDYTVLIDYVTDER